MRERKIKISYIKRTFAKKGFICLGTAFVALLLCGASLRISIAMAGNGDLRVGALGLSSVLFAGTGLFYGGLSFLERDKNYLLSKIGMVLSGLLLIFWFCLLIAGLRA